jgi:predicted tellurium resistance membrane protein TerC
MDLASLFTLNSLVALVTLTILEIVLGVDNIIFIAIVTDGLPHAQQQPARVAGLWLALFGRIAMVLGVTWLLSLDHVLFTVLAHGFSFKDLILLAGGVFLLYKATLEIYRTTEVKDAAEQESERPSGRHGNLVATVIQIAVIDMIFAIDSVLTAVGLTSQTVLIIIAMSIAIFAMMIWAGKLADFIHAHPSLKVLALAFLVLVGVLLISDAFGQQIDRTYVYVAILFSLGVEALNLRRQRNLERRRGVSREDPPAVSEAGGTSCS